MMMTSRFPGLVALEAGDAFSRSSSSTRWKIALVRPTQVDVLQAHAHQPRQACETVLSERLMLNKW
jgi:hypothetical protein